MTYSVVANLLIAHSAGFRGWTHSDDIAARCCLVVEPVAVVQAAVGIGSAVAVAAIGGVGVAVGSAVDGPGLGLGLGLALAEGVVGDGVERAGLSNDGLLDEAERAGLVGVVADGVGIGLALGNVDGAGRVGNILALGGVVEGGHDGLLVDDGLLVHHGLVGVGGDGILVEHLGVGLGLALGDVDGAGVLGMILALGGVVLGLDGVVGVGLDGQGRVVDDGGDDGLFVDEGLHEGLLVHEGLDGGVAVGHVVVVGLGLALQDGVRDAGRRGLVLGHDDGHS